jgi:hypothetical protein
MVGEWDIGAAAGNVSIGQQNTYGDFDQIFRSGRLDVRNPANTFSYSLTGAAIAANRAITFPLLIADDVFVTEAMIQTILNKSINVSNNTITDTSQAIGDLLRNNGTKFVRFAKSGTGGQFLRTNAGGTDIEWATISAGGGDVSTTQQNTYGDFDQIFRSGRLDVRNPANTFSYSIVGAAIAAARNVTLPLLTADDTFQTLAAAQTPTNKTINVDSNTLAHSTTNAVGDILKGDGSKFGRLARGTANQVLAVNSGGTDIGWATPATGGFGEMLQAYFGTNGIDNPGTTYTNSLMVGTFTAYSSARARTSIDFTGFTQYKIVMTIARVGGTWDIKICDDTNATNILHEFTGIAADSTQFSTLASLPAWCTGVQMIKIMVRAGDTSSDIMLPSTSVILK